MGDDPFNTTRILHDARKLISQTRLPRNFHQERLRQVCNKSVSRVVEECCNFAFALQQSLPASLFQLRLNSVRKYILVGRARNRREDWLARAAMRLGNLVQLS